jgi:exonuclease SbcC
VAAERARDEASVAEADARERAGLAREAVAAARIAAGGLDGAEAEESSPPRPRRRPRPSVRPRNSPASQRRARAEQAAAADDERRAACVEHLATARERARAAESDISRLEAVVTAARGSFATVAARIDAVAEERDRARAVVVADAARDERARAHLDARQELDALLAASGFDDLDAAGRRSSPTRRSRGSTSRSPTTRRSCRRRARLLELELDAGGDDPRPTTSTFLAMPSSSPMPRAPMRSPLTPAPSARPRRSRICCSRSTVPWRRCRRAPTRPPP